MIITEKIIKKMKSHRCLTDLWDKCDQIGIIKHARSLLMNEAPLNRSLDLIRINFARKGLMETKVSPYTLKVLTYIAKRGYRVKEAFINEGIEHEVKLIRVVIRNNIELDLTSFNIHSILSAIKLYIKEDLKFFIPPEVLDSVIRNKIDKNYMKNLKGILFTITNDKRKFFKQLLNIFYQLEMHPHLYKKYSEDFVLVISEVFFPNYFQSDIEIFANFDIICEILNCESYWDCLNYKDSFFRTLHKITY